VTPSPEALVLLMVAAGFAGFVDAVVGGGGLVQLPALVLGLPGAAPVQVLATNKLASLCGTTVASATYYRRVRPHAGTFVPLMAFAFLGSLAGAAVASRIPARRQGQRWVLNEDDLDVIATYFRDRPAPSHRQGAAARARAGKR
jgi:uncharacterized membrane protein YfcA